MIKAVLFDMGNTLLEFETQPWLILAERALRSVYDLLLTGPHAKDLPAFVAFHRRHGEIVRAEEQREPGREVPLASSLPRLIDELGLVKERSRLSDLLLRHYEPVVAQVSIYPDAMPTLIRLRSDGIRIGLVSNTLWPKEFHLRDLARYEILHLFDSMVFSSEIGYQKPHPRIFNRCLEELGVRASEAVFVGDRPRADIAGAQSVGMRGIRKNHAHGEALAGVRPDAVIDHLAELPPILEAMERESALQRTRI